MVSHAADLPRPGPTPSTVGMAQLPIPSPFALSSSGRSHAAVEVRTPARVHLGMFSFGQAAMRGFGGIGVMLESPGVEVRMERDTEFQGVGTLGERAVEFARECAAAMRLDRHAACRIEVLSAPRSHVGLGSGTQLALAVAAGLHALHAPPDSPRGPIEIGKERRFCAEEALALGRTVGRGRRSCVGIYGFGGGGLIVEAGRWLPAGPAAVGVSPLIAQVRLPEVWRGVLVIRRDAEGLYGNPEKEAFSRLPAVDPGVTAELARLALLELLPAAMEGDFARFSSALHAYGRLAGVPFESESGRLPFHEATGRLIDRLGEIGFRGAAQSSWGPAVLVCCQSDADAQTLVGRLTSEGFDRDHDLVIARFESRGARLRFTAAVR